MPRVYCVTANDTQIRLYYFATKREAEAKVREFVADYESDGRDFDPPQIDPIDVKPTREGIAEALNDVMEYTCFNEG